MKSLLEVFIMTFGKLLGYGSAAASFLWGATSSYLNGGNLLGNVAAASALIVPVAAIAAVAVAVVNRFSASKQETVVDRVEPSNPERSIVPFQSKEQEQDYRPDPQFDAMLQERLYRPDPQFDAMLQERLYRPDPQFDAMLQEQFYQNLRVEEEPVVQASLIRKPLAICWVESAASAVVDGAADAVVNVLGRFTNEDGNRRSHRNQ